MSDLKVFTQDEIQINKVLLENQLFEIGEAIARGDMLALERTALGREILRGFETAMNRWVTND